MADDKAKPQTFPDGSQLDGLFLREARPPYGARRSSAIDSPRTPPPSAPSAPSTSTPEKGGALEEGFPADKTTPQPLADNAILDGPGAWPLYVARSSASASPPTPPSSASSSTPSTLPPTPSDLPSPPE